MNRQEIELLVAEKGACCISIIIPTDKIAPHKNAPIIRKAVFKARVLLDESPYSEDIKKSFSKKLDQALKSSFPVFSLGLGIFISENHLTKVTFPFDVKQRITIGEAFESRDLLYLEQFLRPYFVLAISRHAVHLYSALMNKLEEIKHSGFPMVVKEQYEYEHPSIGSGSSSHLKDFENDKTITAAIRTKAMLLEANKRLVPIFTNHEIKFIIAGTQKVTSAFLAISSFRSNIIGFVHGSFSKKNLNMLREEAWEVFVMNEKAENEKIVQHLLDSGHLIRGLEPAWKATTEGRGVLLAVEKDYHCQGYLIPNINALFQKKPKKPYEEIPDAVEVLIRTAHEKHMPVYFIDHKELKGLPPITLQTR